MCITIGHLSHKKCPGNWRVLRHNLSHKWVRAPFHFFILILSLSNLSLDGFSGKTRNLRRTLGSHPDPCWFASSFQGYKQIWFPSRSVTVPSQGRDMSPNAGSRPSSLASFCLCLLVLSREGGHDPFHMVSFKGYSQHPSPGKRRLVMESPSQN